jgi:hypothetical protein
MDMAKLLFVGILFLMMIGYFLTFYRMINEKSTELEEETEDSPYV